MIVQRNSSQKCRSDLCDLTFLVPTRIDSPERKENLDSLIHYTFRHFITRFIVLEADVIRKFFPDTVYEGFCYEFIEDTDEIFHRTKWINKLISLSQTPYVAVWDCDAIAPPEQIIETIESLRKGNSVMAFPYNGEFYACDKLTSDLFRKFLHTEILEKTKPVMHLMHGYHSAGGAYMVNKAVYISAGGENENFYGWGPEDTERIKRLEILNLPIHYADGFLFHLFHPILKNSRFASDDIERNNRKELLKTCSKNIT
jgi:hypothetical protein